MDLVVFIIAMAALGLLITLGNERNRAAIERVNQTAQEWAMQDLRLKRGTAEKAIEIRDTTHWLQSAASKALGTSIKLSAPEFLSDPDALLCFEAETGSRFAFSSDSPRELQRNLRRKKKNALDGASVNPLAVKLKKRTNIIPMNILNAGILFDLELPIAWKQITGQHLSSEQLWLYIFPEGNG